MDPLVVSASVTLPAASMTWTAVRASGPGGQNVNKVSSKVELRFDPRAATLDEWTLSRLRALAGASRLDAEGRVVLVSQKTRDQRQNLEDARDKLRLLVEAAMVRPKRRRPTRPTRSSNARRLDSKSRDSRKKQDRRGGFGD
jgi:ribosome-associated protein